ncbi:carboxypeptidase-like regulatory domain-containing protein [uncultured Methanobrevibacter sp.]|uniref:carboxypeptidase-like regulatory domain-containing protein n=1 Tax=uncultured Methanobrevibacter sp. TaxID=253161 RepID=UPI0025D0FB8D|nr:carboxypeptidase-like regulatory domain-containing protein [uncultured Methanobrevibacter sp.]
MNKKTNTICFIFILLFLISAVSAADSENETLQQIQPDYQKDLSTVNVENSETKNIEKLGETQEVERKKVTLTAPDVKMNYNDGSKFTATLKYKKKVIANAKIQIQINGQTFTKTTDKTGKASINLNYKSGTYNVLSICRENGEFEGATVKSTVTIKSTIKCSDFSKYYKNSAKYPSTFYDKKGKPLKNNAVKFKLDKKIYSVKTNSKGIAKLAIDLKPGKYSILLTNPKTTESVTKTVTVKSLIETKDLTLTEDKKAKLNVKVLNSNGKASPNKKVTIKLNGKTYTKTTDKNGIARLNVRLNSGKYTVTIQYGGLTCKNKITVNKVIRATKFMHTTLIPDYVNVTWTHVAENSVYSVKTGLNGIIKMPKNEIFAIKIGDKSYLFSNTKISGTNSTVIGYKSHLIPFDGSEVKSDKNRSNLKGSGIIISRANGFTQIDYLSNTNDNVEIFGFYADKGPEHSETLKYMQNDKITATVTFYTHSYDELGLKYSLGKFYQKTIYDFNYKSYDEITKHNTGTIRFTNTNTPVTFSYFGNSIAGYPSKENIITKFEINGKENLVKQETISYGLGEKYRRTLGFEVLQAYSIINEKITKDILKSWVGKNKLYLDRFGVMNVYGMHLASLETVWLADKLADEYASKFDVSWKRDHTVTILGGINLEDTYLDILNADMGMGVKGSADNVVSFRFMNSLQLPNLEEYSLEEVATRFWNFTTNSQDNMYNAIHNSKTSIAIMGDMMYIFAEDGSSSAIIANTTNGIVSLIHSHNNATYKGASIATACDCCSVGTIPNDIISGINNALNLFSPAESKLAELLNQIHPMSKMAYKTLSFLGGKVLKGITKACLSILGTMVFIQQTGVEIRDEYFDDGDWYKLMDTVTFTRPGYNQNKKIYNIPNNKGGYDYIEVEINKDLSLNRNNAIYISNGQTRKLTKAETYNYFSDETWTPINVPAKYWDESWRGN